MGLALPANANLVYQGEYNPNQNLQEYFNESYPNYDKSIIYIFWRGGEECYECAQTITLIEQIINQNFGDQYSVFVINYSNDSEYNFIETYNLTEPLALVIVKVDDGATFGYKKLVDLQSQSSDPVSFKDYLVNQINSFLD